MITAIVLIATLWFQISQSRENAANQIQSAEDLAWREMLKKVGVRNAGDDITTPTLIKSFYQSKKYGNQAREISILYLGNVVDRAHFKILFNDIVTTTSWKDIDHLVTLSNILRTQLIGLNKEKKPDLAFEVGEELAYVASEIIKVLSIDDSSRPKNIDLRGVTFNYLVLDSVNFNGANLSGARFLFCSTRNTNFTNVSNYDDEFDPSDWTGTAWWRTQQLDKRLIKFLKESYPKNDTINYWQAKHDTTNYSLTDTNDYLKLN